MSHVPREIAPGRRLDRRHSIALVGLAALFAFYLLQGLLDRHVNVKLPGVPGDPLTISVYWGYRGIMIAAGIWLALGDGRFWSRLPAAALLLVVTWLAWTISLYVAGKPSVWWGNTMSLHLPYLLVASSIPLALARVGNGLRLQVEGPPLLSLPRRFSLAQTLVLVTAIAAACAAVRAAPSVHRFGFSVLWQPHAHGDTAVWAVCEVLVTVPAALLLVFRPRWSLVAVVYFALAALLATYLERKLASGTGYVHRLEYAIAALVQLGLVLLTLRLMGYRHMAQRSPLVAGLPQQQPRHPAENGPA